MIHEGIISCATRFESGQLNLATQHNCNAEGLEASPSLAGPKNVKRPVGCSADMVGHRARDQNYKEPGFEEKYVHQTGTNLEVSIMGVVRVIVRELRRRQAAGSGGSS